VRFQYGGTDLVRGTVNGTPVDYLGGLRIDEPLVRGGNEFYLADAIGSIVALANPSGAIATCTPDAPELAILHAWLDSWSGLGLGVVGMQRHGYDLSLTHDRSGWRATFLHRSHVLNPWVGQVLTWWPTSWRAVQNQADRLCHRVSCDFSD